MTAIHPGAEPYAKSLREHLAGALEALGDDYEPRTHHLLEDGRPRYINRLILEDSPYLLQHAHNPVDWYPWGEEAFERAKRENKPVFLSIGYSTCHWCHVMERESFESEEIAAILNQHFIAIKVDREQRPDIDDLYMTAVQMLTGHGGWPMSSFLTPEAQPFYGGTYYPPAQFGVLLQRIQGAWTEKRGEVEESAQRLTEAVRQVTSARGAAGEVGETAIRRSVEQILNYQDRNLGGFGGAPKFPHEPEILLLLRQAWRWNDGEALTAALLALDHMARGGIYDQVGGGFHRYSVDAEWLVPHFEKMLYNQAHLSRAYLLAHRLTGEPFFARIARQTLDYVLREMTSPSGAFYSATDADSEGEEGIFFVWTPEQLKAALSEDDAAFAMDLWGVTEAGNFEGRNILHLDRSLAEEAADRDLPLDDLLTRVDGLRETLWQVREEREHPLRDDKLLAAWNGMMITAFADGARHLGEPRYLEAAQRAAEDLWQHQVREDGSLFRVRLGGSASVEGQQEDYAYLMEAFLNLHDLGVQGPWLERTRQLADVMLQRFWDRDVGGFFQSAEGVDPLLIGRPKSPGDGAIPSGNSVAVLALARLARRLGEPTYGDRAEATVAAFAERIQAQPMGFAYLLGGLDEHLHGGLGELRYGAKGHLRVEVRPGKDDEHLTLHLSLAEGWHINAHRPLDEYLVGTRIQPAENSAGSLGLGAAHYPEPEEVSLGFQEEPLAVYQGEVEIPFEIAGEGRRLAFALRFQACDDRQCLEPETLGFVVMLPLPDPS